jgi:alkanesulfonate monooxygenase SsuD/methylene tetrahydromethanopterin reductase-like flavin-dependent oxidoreductase (luciferase family)
VVLSYVAARTKRIRLAPAVVVLPLHHPIAVAEAWATLDLLSSGRVDFAAGRGYDRREYLPFGVSFEQNQSIFEEALEIVQRLWSTGERQDFQGRYYSFQNVRVTPRPVQTPIPSYVGSWSRPSVELAARLGCGLIVAPFAAAMTYGGLQEVATLYRELCDSHGNEPKRLMCSYFIHFADRAKEERAARARQIRYYKECLIAAFPGDPASAPPSYRYFVDIVHRLEHIHAEDLTENAVLIGSSDQITETLKKVEVAGFDEVILYFNVGLKEHRRVKEEMARFMAEVAPAFESVPTSGAAT